MHYTVSVSSGGRKTSLSCNLGANDLITDKRVFLRLGLSNCAGCRQRAARNSLQLSFSVSQRRMALFTNAVLKLLNCGHSTARRVMHIQPGIRVLFVLNVNTERYRQLWVLEVNMRWKDTEGQPGERIHFLLLLT